MAIVIVSIMWVVSLYFLFQNKLNLTPRTQEKGKWLFCGIGSAAFVLCGIYFTIIEPNQWIKSGFGAGFFALCLVVAIINYRKA
jgi:hypothetical protein